jgi:hypothetical protein
LLSGTFLEQRTVAVPNSLKLSEAELSSFAQHDHQLAAAAEPKLSIRALVEHGRGGVPAPEDAAGRERGSQ